MSLDFCLLTVAINWVHSLIRCRLYLLHPSKDKECNIVLHTIKVHTSLVCVSIRVHHAIQRQRAEDRGLLIMLTNNLQVKNTIFCVSARRLRLKTVGVRFEESLCVGISKGMDIALSTKRWRTRNWHQSMWWCWLHKALLRTEDIVDFAGNATVAIDYNLFLGLAQVHYFLGDTEKAHYTQWMFGRNSETGHHIANHAIKLVRRIQSWRIQHLQGHKILEWNPPNLSMEEWSAMPQGDVSTC